MRAMRTAADRFRRKERSFAVIAPGNHVQKTADRKAEHKKKNPEHKPIVTKTSANQKSRRGGIFENRTIYL
jgi:hypothetical protein